MVLQLTLRTSFNTEVEGCDSAVHYPKHALLGNTYVDSSGCSAIELLTAICRQRRTLDWDQFKGGQVVFTHQGRTAIDLACEAFGLRTGDEVLVPAYNCGSEVDPYLSRGLRVKMYGVGEDLCLSLNEIFKSVTNKTKLIHVTHWFGVAHDISELIARSRKLGIVVLEDCAHALFCERKGVPVGNQASASIFSFRKSLATPDGGALVLRCSSEWKVPRLRRPKLSTIGRKTLRLCAPHWKTSASGRFLSDVANLVRDPRRSRCVVHPGVMPNSYRFQVTNKHRKMSAIAVGAIASVRPQTVRAVRRSNYAKVESVCSQWRQARPLFTYLPKGVCPIVFPVVTRSENERDSLVRELRKRRIAAIAWWSGFHPDLCWDGFACSKQLKNRIVSIPVHHNLRENQIDYLMEVLSAVRI